MKLACLTLLAACGNNLPPPGTCNVSGTGPATTTTIHFINAQVGFDDLRFAPDLGKVVAVPEGTGKLFLVDPDTDQLTMIPVPIEVASADGKGTTVYAADRGAQQITIVDTVAGLVTGNAQLDSGPDYVRASPTTDEVWVSLPSAGRIDIFTIADASLVKAGSISIGDPEGLEFDGAGRAYTNDSGKLVAIDVASRSIAGSWDDGCGSSHGFPQSDLAFGLAFGGCANNGGAAVLTTTGDLRTGIEAGGGPAILAYDQTLHHLYLRGDGAPSLDIIGVCPDGGLTTFETVTIPSRGHGATADQRGHAWVCDPLNGGIVKITDPYPATM